MGWFNWRLSKNRLDIQIKIIDEEKRKFIVTPHGKKYEELCEAVLWESFI